MIDIFPDKVMKGLLEHPEGNPSIRSSIYTHTRSIAHELLPLMLEIYSWDEPSTGKIDGSREKRGRAKHVFLQLTNHCKFRDHVSSDLLSDDYSVCAVGAKS